MVRPVLVLDVDGVLNPYGGGCADGYVEHELFPGEEPVRVCRLHGVWVLELAEVFDVVWGTAWGAEANRLLGPLLGLPRLPYVEFPPAPFAAALKMPAIDRHLGDRALSWAGDPQ